MQNVNVLTTGYENSAGYALAQDGHMWTGTRCGLGYNILK
jgi:hypothetical protein